MTRNVFENNNPEVSAEQEEADYEALNGRSHTFLPPLPEGYRYELMELPSGRMAVVMLRGSM
ncbi:hypothetical protein SscP1EGY_22 [Streptomyces phage SscP1EGY]|nr:hypothetical protein SscP1EGY_22 [Streptomyces phage SscP1EGY]